MILLLSNSQVDEMEDADGAWTTFAEISLNARIRDVVAYFGGVGTMPSRAPRFAQDASRAAIAASSSGSTEEVMRELSFREGSPNNEPQGALRAVPDASGVFEEKGAPADTSVTGAQFSDRGVSIGIERHPATWGLIARSRALPDPAVAAKLPPDVCDPGSRLPGTSPELEFVAALSPPVTSVSRPTFDSASASREPVTRFTPHEMALQSPVTRPPFELVERLSALSPLSRPARLVVDPSTAPGWSMALVSLALPIPEIELRLEKLSTISSAAIRDVIHKPPIFHWR